MVQKAMRTAPIDVGDVPTGCLIDGEWRTGPGFAVMDKFVDSPVAEVTAARRQWVAEAVELGTAVVGEKLLPPWRRAEILTRAAELIADNRDRFIRLMAAEAGFAYADAATEVERAVSTLRICSGEATRIAGEVVAFGATPGHENRLGFTIRSPLGVIGAITPFNSPLNVVLHKVAPALAAGNAVILKPSPLAPLSAGLLCSILLDAGLPPRHISLVHGDGARVGTWLLAEPDIAFYAFTGSTSAGRKIAAGAGLRRTQLELGSIASAVVCATADLDVAVPKIANAAFRKAGQVCTSIQRLYAHRSIFEAVLDRLGSAIRSMPWGDPLEPVVRVGPMISPAALERAAESIGKAAANGAVIRFGGGHTSTVHEPTVLADVPADAEVLTCEVFAPVLSVILFDDVGQAFASANDTPFGLSCGVFTHSTVEMHQAIETLRFGSVHINETSSARTDEMPFGGIKDSGHGHEGPRYATRAMTEERLITVNP